jgi:hypothetical protein
MDTKHSGRSNRLHPPSRLELQLSATLLRRIGDVATSNLLSCLSDPEQEAPPNEIGPKEARPRCKISTSPTLSRTLRQIIETPNDLETGMRQNKKELRWENSIHGTTCRYGFSLLSGTRGLGGFGNSVSASKFLTKALSLSSGFSRPRLGLLLVKFILITILLC